MAAAVLLLAVPLAAFAASAAPIAPQTLELGKGPTIVIVHSLGGSRTTWMPTVRKLTATRRVVLVDLPGHGGSALPDPFTLEAAAEDLDLVLAKQNPDSTVLVGHGLGGLLLLQDLKVHPDRARGLVLVDGAVRSPLKTDDAEMLKMFNEALDEHYDEFIARAYRNAGRDSVESVRVRALVAQVPPGTMKTYWRAVLTADATAAFKSLKIPVLYVATDKVMKDKDWATQGKLLGFDDPALVPMRRMAGAGTLVMQDQPDSLAAIISEFSKQVLATKK
jgi:pimeloyl-ACP methyl ester carboxylesterase